MKSTIEFSDQLQAEIERARRQYGLTMRALVERGIRLAIAEQEAAYGTRVVLPVDGDPSIAREDDAVHLVRAARAEDIPVVSPAPR